jgi:flagellar hook-associated protein 2
MAVDSLNTSNRVTGISSGVDTESLVKAMLSYTQARVDKQFQSKTRLEWKRDAYREVNSSLNAFRQKYMSTINASSNMLSSATYRAYKTNLLSDSSAVSVSANDKASLGKTTINRIDQLASAAKAQGSSNVFSSELKSTGTKLSDLAFTTALEFEDDEISFSINGREFTFSRDDTLATVISTVNSDKDANVQMSFKSLTQGFSITSRTTGASSKVEIVNIKGNAFGATEEDPENPGQSVYTAGAFGIDAGAYAGGNAKLVIDNVEVERENNTFTIDGITYTLKDTSASAVSFTVEQDLDATIQKVKDFVTAYNEMIDSLQSKLGEKINYDYDPLTDDQKDGMEDDEIENWQEAAKSGLLRNDTTVGNMLSTMRKAFYTEVSGTGITAAGIGLTTGIWSDQGKITLNEDKLRAALEENPDAVANVFAKTSTAADSATRFGESGLMSRISAAMSQCTSQISSVSISNLNKNISSATTALDELENRMSDEEEKYWMKMTAMETALAKLNSQNSWLSAQLSSLG